ncbi:MAG: transposase [Gammaproteobacteria bacterium]|nr:transposase [Gammaproteobacteria bacterium]MDH5692550.1 transposase [Gammaproteobacteria bacterium]
MARANRHFLPGYVWHITHRCHQREFLFKFSKDRRRWRYWLYEARKRYGLSVLNYTVTSNHIHLLVRDTGKDAIPKSMQLIAGRTAQEYNQRKSRKGAFWEDRYHATAVNTESHFFRCQRYIDLNMVRAGVVRHPEHWLECGYNEIQNPPQRYRVIDINALTLIGGFATFSSYQEAHRICVQNSLSKQSGLDRDNIWTQSIAVGTEEFVKELITKLGPKARGRSIFSDVPGYQIKEAAPAYR